MKRDALSLFGPAMAADPYPTYHRLRAIDPVLWSDEQEAWIVTGYDAVSAALFDPRLSSDRADLFQKLAGDPALEPFFSFVSKRMVYTDTPTHERLRGAVSRAFTPHAVEAMRPGIERVVADLLDAAVPKRSIDLINDFALPLPVIIVSELLGIPEADRDRLHRWSERIVAFFSTHPARVPHQQYLQAQAAMQEVVDYFREFLAHPRPNGPPGLLHRMADVEHEGHRLSEMELFANANIFLVAGEYITNVIGNGMLALLESPEQMEALLRNPSLLPNAVEELLRCVGPLQFTHRVAKDDVPLADKIIRRGQLVFLFLAAANRDPAHFPDPDRLDIARDVHKHLALGLGHHFCLGAPLARMQLQVAFREMLSRLPNLKRTPGPIIYRDNFNVRGLKALPFTFGHV